MEDQAAKRKGFLGSKNPWNGFWRDFWGQTNVKKIRRLFLEWYFKNGSYWNRFWSGLELEVFVSFKNVFKKCFWNAVEDLKVSELSE